MRPLLTALTYTLLILLPVACTKRPKPTDPNVRSTKDHDLAYVTTFRLTPADEIDVDWGRLANEITDDSQIRDRLNKLTQQYPASNERGSVEQLLKLAYENLCDPNGNSEFAANTILFFVDVNAPAILRDALRHKELFIVGTAANGISDRADRGFKDLDAIPYLIAHLELYNDMPGGSNITGVNNALARAILKITDLDTGGRQIDRFGGTAWVAEFAREWSKQHDITIPHHYTEDPNR